MYRYIVAIQTGASGYIMISSFGDFIPMHDYMKCNPRWGQYFASVECAEQSQYKCDLAERAEGQGSKLSLPIETVTVKYTDDRLKIWNSLCGHVGLDVTELTVTDKIQNYRHAKEFHGMSLFISCVNRYMNVCLFANRFLIISVHTILD